MIEEDFGSGGNGDAVAREDFDADFEVGRFADFEERCAGGDGAGAFLHDAQDASAHRGGDVQDFGGGGVAGLGAEEDGAGLFEFVVGDLEAEGGGAFVLVGDGFAGEGEIEFLLGEDFLVEEVLGAGEFGAGLFEVGFVAGVAGGGLGAGAFGAAHAGLGLREAAGVQEVGAAGFEDGEDGDAGFDGGSGFEVDAAEVSAGGSGDDVAVADAGLAFFVHGDEERAARGDGGLDGEGARPESDDDEREEERAADVGQPAAAVGGGRGVAVKGGGSGGGGRGHGSDSVDTKFGGWPQEGAEDAKIRGDCFCEFCDFLRLNSGLISRGL